MNRVRLVNTDKWSQFCDGTTRTTGESYCAQAGNPGGSAAVVGQPLYGPPAGYGIMQLDPPPAIDAMWNWQENIGWSEIGLDTLAGAKQPQPLGGTNSQAYPFWIRQMEQWQQYNRDQASNGLPTAAPPPDQHEGACTFTLPVDAAGNPIQDSNGVPISNLGQANTYWFGDAELIKKYNGLGPAPGQKNGAAYISWVNNSWSCYRGNPVSASTVQDVCSCTTYNSSTCLHTSASSASGPGPCK